MLDVGCCIGWYVEKLRQRKFQARYYGVDITPNFVKRAQRANPNEEFEVGDVRRLRWSDGEFDLVFAGGVLMHLAPKDLCRAMSELFRIARKTVFIYTYGDRKRDRVEYDFKNEFFNVYYTLGTLKSCVPDGWEVSDNYFFQDERHFVEFSRPRFCAVS